MNASKTFQLITAINKEGLIGLKQDSIYTLPWEPISVDMIAFKKLTTTVNPGNRHAIICGSHTWYSLPDAYCRNKNRFNIVVHRNKSITNAVCAPSFKEALVLAQNEPHIQSIFVIGGSAIYNEALQHPQLAQIHLTVTDVVLPLNIVVNEKIYFPLSVSQIDCLVQCNALSVVNNYSITDRATAIDCIYTLYQCSNQFHTIYSKLTKINRITVPHYSAIIPTDETQYLDLIRKIKTTGKWKTSRNGNTLGIFGCQLRYDLRAGYPLCTVKRSYPKTIFEELMWMIRGQTDVGILQAKGVHVWDKNSSAEYLAKHNLAYAENDIGPGYGFQMRHYGATYVDCQTDYTDCGTDQLTQCIHLIKNDPTSRRIVIDLWNPNHIDKMALPPCHMVYTFSVQSPTTNTDRGTLDCHLFQRSWDVMLGWNTTTAALLTYLLAHHCGLNPGVLVHSISDAHLYQTHIDTGAIDTLLQRVPRLPPQLTFLRQRPHIEDYTFEDLVIKDYYPYPPIKLTMVA